MNFFASNIKYLRKKKGLTQTELANKLGVNRPKIGSYEEARAEPKLTTLQRFSHFYKVGVDDLLEKDLSKEVTAEKDIQGSSLRILPIIVDTNDEERISVVPAKAAAGYLNGYADVEYVEELPTFNLPLNELSRNNTYRIFQIKGDSMLPVPSNAYVIAAYLQDWRQVKDGETYVVVSATEGIVYKRIKKSLKEDKSITLTSDNTVYPTFSLPLEDVKEIWQAKGIINFDLSKPEEADPQLDKMNAMLLQLQQEMHALKSK